MLDRHPPYRGTTTRFRDAPETIADATTTPSATVTLESYTLAADGAVTVSVVRPEQKAITLVCRRE